MNIKRKNVSNTIIYIYFLNNNNNILKVYFIIFIYLLIDLLV